MLWNGRQGITTVALQFIVVVLFNDTQNVKCIRVVFHLQLFLSLSRRRQSPAVCDLIIKLHLLLHAVLSMIHLIYTSHGRWLMWRTYSSTPVHSSSRKKSRFLKQSCDFITFTSSQKMVSNRAVANINNKTSHVGYHNEIRCDRHVTFEIFLQRWTAEPVKLSACWTTLTTTNYCKTGYPQNRKQCTWTI